MVFTSIRTLRLHGPSKQSFENFDRISSYKVRHQTYYKPQKPPPIEPGNSHSDRNFTQWKNKVYSRPTKSHTSTHLKILIASSTVENFASSCVSA